MRAILTSYFTSREDPQRGACTNKDDHEKLMLKKDVERLKIPCYVFYDDLSTEFVRENSSDYMIFLPVNPPNISVNDSRFLIYREWLNSHKFDQVWFSDLFDVRINLDPKVLPKRKFYCGEHPYLLSEEEAETTDGLYVCSLIKNIYEEIPAHVLGKPILMAGTWGGEYSFCQSFLDRFCNEIVRTTNEGFYNVNLPVFNVLAHRENYYGRFPLNSEFRKYQYDAPAVFIHK